MKVEKLIATLDAIKENDVTEEIKIGWLNDVEGRVACEIYGKNADDLTFLVNGEDELSVCEPYSRIYVLYLAAMVDFSKGKYDMYASAISEYEKAFSEYARYVIRNR